MIKADKIEGVVLTFSEALRPASAARLSNYTITYGRKLPIARAVYRAAARTVTLALARPLGKSTRYTVTVKGSAGGITDRAGNLLDGNRDGIAGGNFTHRQARTIAFFPTPQTRFSVLSGSQANYSPAPVSTVGQPNTVDPIPTVGAGRAEPNTIDPANLSDLDTEALRQWLSSTTEPGNTVRTDGFASVDILSRAGVGHGGGTLIASRHVLTAAHLVDGFAVADLRFAVGGTSYGVARVYVHPDFGPARLGKDDANDIAVLELNRDAVDVTPSTLLRSAPQVGEELTLVGFGPRPGDGGDGQTLTVKHRGTTPVDGVTAALVTWTFDHAGESTTVEGDSGSPAFVQRDGVYLVAAVASGGTQVDSGLGDFAYNTRVDAYLNWIDGIVRTASI